MIPPRCLHRHLSIGVLFRRPDIACVLGFTAPANAYGRNRARDGIPLPWGNVARRHASTISARLSQAGGGNKDLPGAIKVYEAEPLTVQKSVFIGRACRLDDPSHVPDILAWIMQQKGVAKATHPIIYAWRCKVNGLVQQGDNDDGEWDAGGNLERLLNLLEAENVLVVVTRYFGGVKLGPSRFKYISQAARSALDTGSLLRKRSDKAAAAPATSKPASKKRR